MAERQQVNLYLAQRDSNSSKTSNTSDSEIYRAITIDEKKIKLTSNSKTLQNMSSNKAKKKMKKLRKTQKKLHENWSRGREIRGPVRFHKFRSTFLGLLTVTRSTRFWIFLLSALAVPTKKKSTLNEPSTAHSHAHSPKFRARVPRVAWKFLSLLPPWQQPLAICHRPRPSTSARIPPRAQLCVCNFDAMPIISLSTVLWQWLVNWMEGVGILGED